MEIEAREGLALLDRAATSAATSAATEETAVTLTVLRLNSGNRFDRYWIEHGDLRFLLDSIVMNSRGGYPIHIFTERPR